MIGKPTNFQHVCHVGFNPEAGFVAEQADHNDLQAHFASVGLAPLGFSIFCFVLFFVDFQNGICIYFVKLDLQYGAMIISRQLMFC